MKKALLFSGLAALVMALTPLRTKAQITPEQAAKQDSLVAQEFGLDPIELGQIVYFTTESGTTYAIPMAAYTATDTINGGESSGYAWKEQITPLQDSVLRDSIANLCYDSFELSTMPSEEAYADSVRDHWTRCGYIPTIVESNIRADLINVYPNPTSGKVAIEGNVPKILVRDMQGNVIYESRGKAKNVLDLSKYAAGLYIITAVSNGKVETKKVIKK